MRQRLHLEPIQVVAEVGKEDNWSSMQQVSADLESVDKQKATVNRQR